MPSPEAMAVAAGARIVDALARASAELAAAGCDTPRLDAELLLAEVLGVERARLILDRDRRLDGAVLERFDALVARRREREPVAYILGRKGFRRLELRCDRRALIPRPETELLVEVGLTLPPGARVLDVGTGTGAVALALKHERPDLVISATELSADALSLAAENARALGLEVELVSGDLRAGVECEALLANLPYVPQGAALMPDVARYEPAGALFAGADGLAAIRRLCDELAGVELVALEHGFDQAAAVAELLGAAGFAAVEVLRDLAGHERVTVGRR